MALAVVVGGAGRMGRWFANFLNRSGYNVVICDRDRRTARNFARRKGFTFIENPTRAVETAQAVILATPTYVNRRLVHELEPHLSRRHLIVEISSIKEPIKATLQAMKRRGIPILSIHPMFGPGVKSLAGHTILTIMVPRGNLTAKDLISRFRKEGARIIGCNFEKHDKFVSLTLTLPHFLNFMLVDSLKSCGIGATELRALGGTSFNLQLLIAEAIYQESFSNEASILMDSRSSLNVLAACVEHNRRALTALARRDKASLLRDLKKGRDFLRRDRMFSGAYGRFNAAVEAANLD